MSNNNHLNNHQGCSIPAPSAHRLQQQPHTTPRGEAVDGCVYQTSPLVQDPFMSRGLTQKLQCAFDAHASQVRHGCWGGCARLAHLSATIEQLLGGASNPSLKSKPNDKMVYYAGHDINIYFVRKLLGLQWLTESYNPNQSPPGGMLRFELLRPSQSSPCATALTAHCAEAAAPASCDLCAGGVQHPLKIANCSSQDIRSYCNEAGHHGAHGGSGGAAAAGIGYVKVFFESQSQDQVRTAAPLSAAPGGQTPDRVFVAIPRCADG